MTFLNLALAFGAAACVIPVVIHLLNRRRFEVVQWGATHLLRPVLNTNRKRIKIEQLILLLTRMAILALLALCMAGPVLTGWRALSGNAKTSLILLFDNSYSMEAGNHAASNLEVAKNNARRLVQHGRRGSDVAVVLMAGGDVAGSKSPTTNRDRAAKDISELPSAFGKSEIAESFDAAERALPKMQHAQRDLVIVSDFQAKDWSGDSAIALNQATELIQAMPIKPTITLMQVGSETTDNVSVTSLDISPRIVAAGQQVSVRVNVRNHGEVPYPGIQFRLRVDGKDTASDQIDLGSREDGQLLFHHVFDQPGSHLVEVTGDADSLKADNSFTAVIPVWDRLPVLLVDGDPQGQPLKSETSFLQLALSPFLVAADGQQPEENLPRADLLHAVVTTPDTLSITSLDDKQVLILANVTRLTETQLNVVKKFVRDGNSLLIFPGDKIDSAWYQARMAGELMPMAWEDLQSKQIGDDARRRSLVRPVSFNPGRQATRQDDGIKIAEERFDHPALEIFNRQRHGNLSAGSINTWYRIKADEEGNVVARLSNGDPLLVESPYGEGRVMTFATTCDDAWNNLPARPFYLPLMQRLVTYLATAVEPPRNLSTGQTIVAHLPIGSGTATITRPDGANVEVTEKERGSRGMIEYSETSQPGIYMIRTASLPEMQYAVTAPREESELALLSEEQLGPLAESLDAKLVHSTDEYIQQDSARRYGREIWKPLYWLMLACVVGEVLLQQLFSGVLRGGT